MANTIKPSKEVSEGGDQTVTPLPERFFTYFCDCEVVLAVVFWGYAAMDVTV